MMGNKSLFGHQRCVLICPAKKLFCINDNMMERLHLLKNTAAFKVVLHGLAHSYIVELLLPEIWGAASDSRPALCWLFLSPA